MIDGDADIELARVLIESFGVRLRAERERRDRISLRDLGELLGIHYVELSKIENGRTCPTAGEVATIQDWMLQRPPFDQEPDGGG